MPSSEVRLYKGIPFDRDYSNVLYADMKTAYSAFRTITSRSYQRPTKNVSHPKGFARSDYTVYLTDFSEDFYECDYIAFKNPNGKWFYGFIDDVVKANNSCGEITYTIDAFQTWFVPASNPIKTCFVSRMITSDKNLYLGTKEPLGVSSYTTTKDEFFVDTFGSYDTDNGIICITAVIDSSIELKLAEAGFAILRTGKIPLLVATRSISGFTRENYISLVESLSENEKYKSIVSSSILFFDYSKDYRSIKIISTGLKIIADDLGGYSPRNEKIKYYPYTKYVVEDRNGGNMEMKPEVLEESGFEVYVGLRVLYSPLSPGTTAVLYHSIGKSETSPGFEYPAAAGAYYSMPIKIGAQFPLSIDQAALYWSSNAISSNVDYLSGSAMTGLGMLGLGVASTATGFLGAGAMAVGGLFSSMKPKVNEAIEMTKTNIPYKDIDSGGISSFLIGQVGVNVYRAHPTIEEMKTIDDYFTKYGYAINKITSPDLTSRPTFNYVEIPDPIFNFTCPLSARQDLTAAFNRGVRLWHSASTFGDYSANNYNQG